ncbi:type VII secretion protein EccCa [Gordonia hydrophobica]|uniref:Type VII secretion protein EccCa n=1 Tax=Gordonia hydrophobica TaxID=40516 RepID=A0ABZ2U200_9ACTN|nr:type VII secretion protein EccCa [Gordonia hydrophobica]MBM7366789.1 S-DNA-T family DNA segregation ATPase FtsK/SpoIIIE [Gordonia hydrophobica]
MSSATIGFARRPRVAVPEAAEGELELTGPPELSRGVPPSMLIRLLPVVMVVAVVGMVGMMFVTGGAGALSNPLFMMFPLMMVMSMVGMFASGGRGGPQRAAELNETRKDYLRHLGQLRETVADTAAQQREAAWWLHPEPSALLGFVGARRMWERRLSDDDFGQVRVGLGSHRLATALVPPETPPSDDLEPVSALALRRFAAAHAAVDDLPTAVALRSFPAVSIGGPHDEAYGLLRAMLCQLAVFHGPDHLRIAVVADDPLDSAWDWIKWLPHVGHPVRRDALGAARMVYPTLAALAADLDDDLSARVGFSRTADSQASTHLLVVVDTDAVDVEDELIGGAGLDGVTVIGLGDAPSPLAAQRGLQLVVLGERIAARTAAGLEDFAVVDRLVAADAEAVARRLARYRLASFDAMLDLDTPLVAADPGLPALLGIPDAGGFTPQAGWRGRSGRDRLRVPIGYTPDGAPVHLDLKESAHGGMGPHGLCIGATGSGKSELLRTLVLALIATHSPDELNLVLVDFKGGATFLGLEQSMHVAAVITNLEQELAMVDRMADALSGELNRRQELLRAAGNFANVTDYEDARAAGAPLDPLPALFIVVDEFSELLAQKPEFADLFVAIGRLGRSLHIHLLLASQRLEESRLRGLDSHLSYRIGLKTFSANESRTVLGVPDAYHLPNSPGAAYLKCDSATPTRFNTCFVSGRYHPPATVDGRGAGSAAAGTAPIPFTTADVPIPERDVVDDERADDSSGATVLATLIEAIAGHGRAPHQVWLPPLEAATTLDALTPVADSGGLAIPYGVIDRPYEQRRDVAWLDVSGAGGHVAVVGGPQSGKSTTLRTLICGAALTHTPEQTQFYCLDFGGGTLSALAGLPHVGAVATKTQLDTIRRTLAEIDGVVARREQIFADHGIESMREYRAARAEGRFADDPFGDVFLVIDGIGVLRADFEILEDKVNALVSGGLAYGIHVIVAASRWGEIRPAMKDLMTGRIELRLGDALDSEMSRRAAAGVPVGRPGRGLTAEEKHLLVALPRIDGVPDATTVSTGTASLVADVAERFGGRAAPRVRTLARTVGFDELTVSPSQGRIPLGLSETDLGPCLLDFDAEPHLLVFADVESGKTEMLRTVVRGIVGSGAPDEVKVVLVDYRRGLLGAVPEDYLGGYASSDRTARPMMAELAEFFEARLPGDDVTAEQLRARSWWSGPTVYLVVDDYDLVSTSSGNALLPLVELLGHGRDIGFRVILTRRSGGLGRALFDPVIASLRDLSCDVLLMNGDPDEGYVVGRHRMQRLPAGRGELISRNHPPEIVQVAIGDPS